MLLIPLKHSLAHAFMLPSLTHLVSTTPLPTSMQSVPMPASSFFTPLHQLSTQPSCYLLKYTPTPTSPLDPPIHPITRMHTYTPSIISSTRPIGPTCTCTVVSTTDSSSSNSPPNMNTAMMSTPPFLYPLNSYHTFHTPSLLFLPLPLTIMPASTMNS